MKGIMTRFTWQQTQWQSVEQRLEQGRLPHALLLTGPKGIGKVAFAEQLAAGLLCEEAPAAQVCGQCQNCRLVASGNHPDKKVVTFEVNPKDGKVAKELKVDQIRGISEALGLMSQFGGYKVAIVYPADRMNVNAANSILKTLEEPTNKTLLMLVTDFPSRLLPTIRSRCQELRFTAPGAQEAATWLQQRLPGQPPEPLLAMASGAPLLALRAGEEGWLELRNRYYSQLLAVAKGQAGAVDMAAEFAGESLEQLLIWAIAWAGDLIKLSTVGNTGIANTDYLTALQELAPRIQLQKIYAWYDELIKLQSLTSSSLNLQQILEKNLLDWQSLSR